MTLYCLKESLSSPNDDFLEHVTRDEPPSWAVGGEADVHSSLRGLLTPSLAFLAEVLIPVHPHVHLEPHHPSTYLG